jgi:hypothetical protein
MKSTFLRLAAVAATVWLSSLATSQAAYLTFGNSFRTAGLGDASALYTGTGNATVTDVNAATGFTDWVERGSNNAPGSGSGTLSNGWLTVEILTGSWGNGPMTGKWSIANPNPLGPDYWSLYGSAAISIHVGNGGADPDHWIWTITTGQTTGTWNYERLSGGGGGFSNMKLYSRGTPPPDQNVPEGGATLALLGLGLAGLSFGRRFLKKA